MKRAGVVVLVCATSLWITGCVGWPEANKDVRELKGLFQGYRGLTQPRDAAESKTVNAIADSIEKSFDHMSDLTK